MQKYGLLEFVKTLISVAITKITYRKARLIRQPAYIRGKSSIYGGIGLTTGFSCRFDLPGNTKTLFIGDNCEIGDNVHIVASKEVIIGNNVLMAARVFISDTSHGKYNDTNQDSPLTPPRERPLHYNPVAIEDNVWIGENVVILPGVKVGKGAIIGANSVVSKNVDKYTIVTGIPAKCIKKYDFEGGMWLKV